MTQASQARDALQSPAAPAAAPTAGSVAGRVAAAAARLGIERLHPEQEHVIAAVLEGRDALMIVPTGFGKSACYQIPSMVLEKPVVMISPLIALLRDQHRIMQERGIDCVRIDGSVRSRARREALDRIEAGGPLLVMTTPETLAVTDVAESLAKVGVGLAAVDEAHCISEWGHDFRPAYRRLGTRLRALGSPPILALTATATERVRSAIVKVLDLRDPSIVASSPHRSNLAFEVIHCEGDERLRAMLRLVRRLRRPGIVYCSTRREVDLVYTILRRFSIPCHRYHGAMLTAERHAEQKRFMRGRNRTVMVATNAFGLGIDKPDIRYILHFQAPASLEQYVQEAGRGGRDGKKSNCILLNDSADRKIHEALLARSRVRPDQLYQLGSALAAWADEDRDPSVEALALSADLGPRVTSALLAKIEEAGLVEMEKDEVRVISQPETLEEDVRSLAGQFETLKTQDSRRLDSIAEYAQQTTCRAVFLCHYFGEEAESPCELCDVCRGRPERPSGFFEPLNAPKPLKKKGRAGRSRNRRKAERAPTEKVSADRGSADKPRRRRRGRRRKKPAAEGVAAAPNAVASRPERAEQAEPTAPSERGEAARSPRRRRRRRRRRPTPE